MVCYPIDSIFIELSSIGHGELARYIEEDSLLRDQKNDTEKKGTPFFVYSFVFLCFFIGNDFLPRCYCYDIREGHIEILIEMIGDFNNLQIRFICSADNHLGRLPCRCELRNFPEEFLFLFI